MTKSNLTSSFAPSGLERHEGVEPYPLSHKSKCTCTGKQNCSCRLNTCVCVHVVIDHVCMSCHWLFSFVLFMSCSCFVLSLTCRCDTLFFTCWVFHLLWHGSDNSGLMSSSSSSTSSEATRVADYTEKRLLRLSVHVVMNVFGKGFGFPWHPQVCHFDKRTLSSWWWLSLTIHKFQKLQSKI